MLAAHKQLPRYPIGVMHITDTLTAAGAERMAVNLINLLPRSQYRAYLCTTRAEGLLANEVATDVQRLQLARRHRFDIAALRRLICFVKEHNIRILHAHLTSLFIARVTSLFAPIAAIIWHDHYGLHGIEDRPVWLYRLAANRVSAVIAVSEQLADWSKSKLRVPPEQVWYIPNFVCSVGDDTQLPVVPGIPGRRIICVANFRAQKDHFTLLKAMALVTRQIPNAHLLLVGALSEVNYAHLVQKEIGQLRLDKNVSVLGERRDVYAIMRASDIGVLSSVAEGLPLVLLEYGTAGLPTVATNVGQCPEVLDENRAGILVPPRSPEPLAEALLSLLSSSERRSELAAKLRQRVRERYSSGAIIEQVCQVYETVLHRS